MPTRPLSSLWIGADLRHDAEVALAVALGAYDADRRLVDQLDIGTEGARATPIDCELRPGWRSMRTVREVTAKALGMVRLRSGRKMRQPAWTCNWSAGRPGGLN